MFSRYVGVDNVWFLFNRPLLTVFIMCHLPWSFPNVFPLCENFTNLGVGGKWAKGNGGSGVGWFSRRLVSPQAQVDAFGDGGKKQSLFMCEIPILGFFEEQFTLWVHRIQSHQIFESLHYVIIDHCWCPISLLFIFVNEGFYAVNDLGWYSHIQWSRTGGNSSCNLNGTNLAYHS